MRRVGPDGVDGYYLGDGQMFDGAGSLAMMPPTNGSIDRLVTGYCRVAMASLVGGTRARSCAYPTAELSRGGSVSGNSAAGSINSSDCLVVKLQNSEVRHTAEIAFCRDAIGANFVTSGGGRCGRNVDHHPW